MSETKRDPTPFERFTNFTRRIIAVPKVEVDRQAKKYQRRREKRRKREQG